MIPGIEFKNGALLEFTVSVLERRYQESGSLMGPVTFGCRLSLSELVYAKRRDSAWGELRVGTFWGEIWSQQNLYIAPNRRIVKATIKTALSEMVTQFVAELREANTLSSYKAPEDYTRDLEKRMKKAAEKAKDSID